MKKKKMVFISHSMPDYSPYLQYYFKVFEENNVEYDVICRNRTGEKIKKDDRLIVYNVQTKNDYSILRKLFDFLGFFKFTLKRLKQEQYDGVLIFTIATALFFKWYLKRNYKNKYIFDIRDYSPLLKYSFVRKITHSLLKHSAMNCISSEGFKEWLPKDIDYVISHNIDINSLSKNNRVIETPQNSIRIITIGSIRDYDSNLDFIVNIANNNHFELSFVGYSQISLELKEYVIKHAINNVSFQGRYYKEEELSIIDNYDMMNIFLPNNTLSNHLMSNRFYLSVLMRKPMIVNNYSFQAEIADKYGLGVILNKGDNFAESINEYWKKLDTEEYNNNCIKFIERVKSDIIYFEEKVRCFIS